MDGNGFVLSTRKVTNEALIVVDDYCMVAGTNYPKDQSSVSAAKIKCRLVRKRA
jgi:hypothetical protein